MHTIKILLKEFCAAHRLTKGYTGKCYNLHGHSYAISITFKAQQLNQYDFVIDFTDIKKIYNQWIEDNLDHATLVNESDRPLLEFLTQEQQKFYLFKGNQNTTVEILAEHLFQQFAQLLHDNKLSLNESAKLSEIQVWETKDSSAIYYPDHIFIEGSPCGQ